MNMTNEVYRIILTDQDLQAKLMLVLNRSYSTIRKWAVDKDEKLTMTKSKAIIDEHLQSKNDYFLELLSEKLGIKKPELVE